ncbi:MAG: carboxypeptidase-like regulatory domain-containing protein, partial [Gammaproteobacteria bacterium]|nr:carboxypeptidase-like regulatory domain-containing protein [Gammaproteobacteria bacterium]
MQLRRLLTPLLMTVVLTACGGGSGGGTTNGGTLPAKDAGSISGIVTDAQTGARLSGVVVTAGANTTHTNSKGEYTLAGLAKGWTAVAFTQNGYAPGYGNAQVGDVGEPLLVPLKKMGAAQAYDNNSTRTLFEKTEAGPYAVIFQPGSLNTTDTQLKVSVTPLDPTLEASTLPGELTTSNALLLPLTFAEFSILDSRNQRVNTKPNLGVAAEPVVELPIPVSLRKLAAY